MKILKLDINYKKEFLHINKITEENIIDPAFFIGFFKEEEIDELLKNEDEASFYGVYEENKLVSISGLFFDVKDFYKELKLLSISPNEVAEIGASMTLPEFCSKGHMLNINKELIKVAKNKNLKYIVATAHPENISSNKSLKNLGMSFIKEFKRSGYLRNLYILSI